MIKLQGKHNKDCKVFTDIIEVSALSTIYNILDDTTFENVPIRIMPDVHDGKDIVIGFTAPLTNKVNPNHIGVDIGCGVLYVEYKTDKNISLETLDKLVRESIPLGFKNNDEPVDISPILSEEVQKICKKLNISPEYALKQVGTLGGGNHFIEFGEIVGRNTIAIHSGSRNFGKQVCDYHSKKAKDSKYLEGDDLKEYLHDMKVAQEFAKINRSTILAKILIILGVKISGIYQYIDTVHNYIDDRNIIRKGAVSAQNGELLVIPMNMRDGILVCKGKGNSDWNCSAPHGAGRIYSRSKAKKELSLEEFEKEMNGIYSTSINQATIDESPMAYKSMEEITSRISDTVEILCKVNPILNIKA